MRDWDPVLIVCVSRRFSQPTARRQEGETNDRRSINTQIRLCDGNISIDEMQVVNLPTAWSHVGRVCPCSESVSLGDLQLLPWQAGLTNAWFAQQTLRSTDVDRTHKPLTAWNRVLRFILLGHILLRIFRTPVVAAYNFIRPLTNINDLWRGCNCCNMYTNLRT